MIPILTLMDDRLKTKGSRDPLGFEVIWSSYGRELIPSLTTVTSSLNNCIEAILCSKYAFLSGTKDTKEIENRFMKMEQLIGYIRVSHEKDVHFQGIMGISRVKQTLDSDVASIRLGRANQILSKQLVYGLWGYYTSALKASKLMKDSRELTEHAQQIISTVEHTDIWKKIVSIGDKGEFTNDAEFKKLSTLLKESAFDVLEIKEKLAQALLQTALKKPLLFNLTGDYLKEIKPENREKKETKAFLNWLVINKKRDVEIAEISSNILQVEQTLNMANWLFDYLRTNNQVTIEEIVTDIKFVKTEEELPTLDKDFSKDRFLSRFIELFNKRDFEGLIQHLLDYHKNQIMGPRGGAPWIDIRNGCINVLSRGGSSNKTLPESWTSIMEKWTYPYFIPSYLSIYRSGFKLNA